MTSKSAKENLDPNKKLPPLGNKNIIPRIHLEKLKNQESPPKSYPESFVSINLYSSKSPSSYRDACSKPSETVVENTGIQRGYFCSGCAIGTNECAVF
ncbi:hypothetical protein SteCoe_21988 [Stentor coeruleus]|uniref:Uncharacterized protein n=1 Tax=Stentor coeruleus TaxID=5963 RepID=A0A1R2BN84_9CILI|nr:hypothetical protein SteCoe_21988 [Stentor coeruleus]